MFDGEVGPQDDLFALLGDADDRVAAVALPRLRHRGPPLAANERFVDAATLAGVDVHVDFRPGEHEWGLWDATIRDVLAWLPLGD